MINFIVCVKSAACGFVPKCVRWIYEYGRRIFSRALKHILQALQPIRFQKSYAVAMFIYFHNPVGECIGIPSRSNSLPIFTIFYE